LRCIGNERPSPVVSSSSRWRRSRRSVTGDALGKQQPLDAIDVLDPLGDQHLALATEAAAIFFLGCRRLDHRAHPRFAALERQ
jgi:hypothetical protein